MRRKKISRWNRKNSGVAANESRKTPRARVGAGVSAFGATAMDTTDYGLFYDKINARGMCDDLVLLENVSNEGIVEVGTQQSGISSVERSPLTGGHVK